MREKKKVLRNEKVDKTVPKIFILFSAILVATLCFLELYLAWKDSVNTVAIVVIAILIVVNLFFIVIATYSEKKKNMLDQNEFFSEITKSQKASYLLIRKNFQLLEARIDLIEKNMKSNQEETLNAQKAVGKIILNRFSEHADAVMNANIEVLSKENQLYDLVKLSSNSDKNDFLVQLQNQLSQYQDEFLNIKKELRDFNELLQKDDEVTKIQDFEERTNQTLLKMDEKLNQILNMPSFVNHNVTVETSSLKDERVDFVEQREALADTSLDEDNLEKETLNTEYTDFEADSKISEETVIFNETNSTQEVSNDLPMDSISADEIRIENSEISQSEDSSAGEISEILFEENDAVSKEEVSDIEQSEEVMHLQEETYNQEENSEIPIAVENANDIENSEMSETADAAMIITDVDTSESRNEETKDEFLLEEEMLYEQQSKEEAIKAISDDIIYNDVNPEKTAPIRDSLDLLEEDFSSIEEKINDNQQDFPNSIIEEESLQLLPLEEIDSTSNKENEDEGSLNNSTKPKRGRKKKSELAESEDTSASAEDVEGLKEEILPEVVEEKEVSVKDDSKVEVEEVKPLMPDLSNSNRKMTPEEIAALIANL